MSLKTKSVLAIVIIFVLWLALDFVIHGIILGSSYATTASLWRPMPEIKMGLMRIVGLVSATCFVGIYACLVAPKSMGRALRYGLIYGVGTGVGMGYGSYAVMPIPYHMALTWFLGAVVETLAAGAVLGLMLKEEAKD